MLWRGHLVLGRGHCVLGRRHLMRLRWCYCAGLGGCHVDGLGDGLGPLSDVYSLLYGLGR